jgi:hypothetical protein
MATELSNHFKYQVCTKKIDFGADVFRGHLMNNAFVFNKDTHATYADISASELATANGYTQNTKVLAGVVPLEDDVGNQFKATWTNTSWTASGGSIGPSNGMCISDPTTVDATVVGFIDFGAAQTAADGGNFNVINQEFDLL